jgi:hypothetical protein
VTWLDNGAVGAHACPIIAPELSGWTSSSNRFGCYLKLKKVKLKKLKKAIAKTSYTGDDSVDNPFATPDVYTQFQLGTITHYWSTVLTPTDRSNWDDLAASVGAPWNGHAPGSVNGFETFVSFQRCRAAQDNLTEAGITFSKWAAHPLEQGFAYVPAWPTPPTLHTAITPAAVGWQIDTTDGVHFADFLAQWSPQSVDIGVTIYVNKPYPPGTHKPKSLIRLIDVIRPTSLNNVDITTIMNQFVGGAPQGWSIDVGMRWARADGDGIPSPLARSTQVINYRPPPPPPTYPNAYVILWRDPSLVWDPSIPAAALAAPTSGVGIPGVFWGINYPASPPQVWIHSTPIPQGSIDVYVALLPV